MIKYIFLLLTLLSSFSVFAGEPWAPSSGYSSVNQTKAYNRFLFTSVTGQYSSDTTFVQSYEHDTQVYNPDFADFDGYWSSTLPNKYLDTQFQDSLSGIDTYTIGSYYAHDLQDNKNYYTYMALRKGNDSDCRGCCSNHGGVVCSGGDANGVGGVCQCADGSALSSTCLAKGCNSCLNKAVIRVKAQRGESSVPYCTSTWCLFSVSTTPSMATFRASGYLGWTY